MSQTGEQCEFPQPEVTSSNCLCRLHQLFQIQIYSVYSDRSQILVFFWLKSLKLRLSVDFQSINETICHEKVVFLAQNYGKKSSQMFKRRIVLLKVNQNANEVSMRDFTAVMCGFYLDKGFYTFRRSGGNQTRGHPVTGLCCFLDRT